MIDNRLAKKHVDKIYNSPAAKQAIANLEAERAKNSELGVIRQLDKKIIAKKKALQVEKEKARKAYAKYLTDSRIAGKYPESRRKVAPTFIFSRVFKTLSMGAGITAGIYGGRKVYDGAGGPEFIDSSNFSRPERESKSIAVRVGNPTPTSLQVD